MESDDYLLKIVEPVLVYILEQRNLAAQYLRSVISQAPWITPIHMQHLPATSTGPVERRNCVLILDHSGMYYPVIHSIKKLKTLFPQSQCIVVGNHASGLDGENLAAYGIAAYLDYGDIDKKLIPAVRQASRVPYAKSGANNSCACPIYPTGNQAGVPQMTKREIEVLELLRHQLSNKEIGNILDITEATVKYHVSNIFVKLKLNRRRELFTVPHQLPNSAITKNAMPGRSIAQSPISALHNARPGLGFARPTLIKENRRPRLITTGISDLTSSDPALK